MRNKLTNMGVKLCQRTKKIGEKKSQEAREDGIDTSGFDRSGWCMGFHSGRRTFGNYHERILF